MLQGASREASTVLDQRLEEVLDSLPDATSGWRLSDQLAEVTSLLDRELALRRTLADPSIAGAAKARLAADLFGKQLDGTTLDLVQACVSARWSHPIDVVDALESLSASAGFASAERDGVLDEVEDELFRFTRLLDRENDLYAALAAPALPAERKTEVVRALLRGKAQDVTIAMVVRAATTRRARTLDRALEEYLRLAAARRARLVATVTTGARLDDAQTERLRQTLQRLYRHDLKLQIEVDPTLVGGVVVRVGDEVIDGTIAHRVAQARRRLAG